MVVANNLVDDEMICFNCGHPKEYHFIKYAGRSLQCGITEVVYDSEMDEERLSDCSCDKFVLDESYLVLSPKED